MISQASLEEMVLTMLCFSSEHAHLVALKLSSAKLFTNPTSKRIAEVSLEHISKYSQPPKQALEYLLEVDMRRGESGKLIRQEITLMAEKISQLDTNFVIEQLDHFIHTQKLTNTLQNALEILQDGGLKKAQELIYKSSSDIVTPSDGLWMKDPKQALSFLNRDESTEFFSSGVDVFDQRGLRPEKKTFYLFLAAAKKGKSWFGIGVGKAALQYHHSLLHVTTEISKEKTAMRYMQAIFGLTKDQVGKIRTPFFQTDGDGNTLVQFRELERDTVFNKSESLMEKLSYWVSCPPWIIKEYPTSMLSTEELSLYLDSLERNEGFKTDIMVVDYADLMKIDSESLRIDTGRLYRELRGIAVSKDLALVSMTQGNRESEDVKLVGKKNVSEDWSKVGTVDTLVTYSQTDEEFKLGLARLYAAASRDAIDKYIVLISQAYKMGQFCLDSTLMNMELVEHIKTLT